MYKANLIKPNRTTVVAYTNQGTYSDAASFKVIKFARKIADKPEGGSQIIEPKKNLRVENAEVLKDFKPKAMQGKTQYIVLLLDTMTEAFEEITVSAGSTASAYAMALKQSVIKDNIIAYVYDTSQKPIKGKADKDIKLDSGLRARLKTFVERCEYYRNCYLWDVQPRSSSTRSYLDDKYSIPDYFFAVGSDYYYMSFDVENHSRYVKATSYIKRNGKWTNVTSLKTLLKKDVGCEATPEPQAS